MSGRKSPRFGILVMFFTVLSHSYFCVGSNSDKLSLELSLGPQAGRRVGKQRLEEYGKITGQVG